MKNTKNKCVKMRSILATQIRSICAIAIIVVISLLADCSSGDDTPPPPVHNHVWGDWKETTAATCIAKGEETRVCTLDAAHKETRETAIDPEAHKWELLEGTAPTCTTDGNGKEKCKLCGIEESGVLPKLGHDWGGWVQTKAPTNTEDGEQERTCKHDANHKEKEVVAALNHTHVWGEWQIITPATCTAKGEKKQVCTLNSAHENIEDIAKDLINGHNYQWQATTPATFTSEGVETEICTHDSTHTRDTRPIPQIPFTSIAALGTWLTSQPANNASAPYTVKLNVSDLGGSPAIAGSAGYVLSISTNYGRYVSLDLSGSTFTSIPYDAVNDRGAFEDCPCLISVTIGSSVTNIGDYAFNSGNLIAINVVAGNSAYTAENGVLYNKAKTVLIQYPAGKTDTSFIIPNSVTNIGDYAFFQSFKLTSVTIPNSVTSIGDSAFDLCSNLTSVTFATGSNIPDANFGNNAFLDNYYPYYGNKLKTAYSTGKAGTYIFNGEWRKQ